MAPIAVADTWYNLRFRAQLYTEFAPKLVWRQSECLPSAFVSLRDGSEMRSVTPRVHRRCPSLLFTTMHRECLLPLLGRPRMIICVFFVAGLNQHASNAWPKPGGYRDLYLKFM